MLRPQSLPPILAETARATRAVSSGTGGIGCGWSDIGHLLATR